MCVICFRLDDGGPPHHSVRTRTTFKYTQIEKKYSIFKWRVANLTDTRFVLVFPFLSFVYLQSIWKLSKTHSRLWDKRNSAVFKFITGIYNWRDCRNDRTGKVKRLTVQLHPQRMYKTSTKRYHMHVPLIHTYTHEHIRVSAHSSLADSHFQPEHVQTIHTINQQYTNTPNRQLSFRFNGKRPAQHTTYISRAHYYGC